MHSWESRLLPAKPDIRWRGAAEEAKLDRYLKVNTVKRRTHSLFRQGLYWYHAIPNMRREWLVPLMTAFDRIVREHAVFCEIFGTI